MARTLKAFTSVKTINDLKNNLLEYPIYTERSFIDDSTLKLALHGLDVMDENISQQFIAYLHHVDTKMNCPGAANGNRYHKVPTILAGAIYFAYYPDTIADLNFDEIAILSKFSTVEPLSFYKQARNRWTKELLSQITSLSTDHMALSSFMELANLKLDSGMSSSQVTEYMGNTPPATLSQTAYDYIGEELEKGGYYLWK